MAIGFSLEGFSALGFVNGIRCNRGTHVAGSMKCC